jgi:hypothetical protein
MIKIEPTGDLVGPINLSHSSFPSSFPHHITANHHFKHHMRNGFHILHANARAQQLDPPDICDGSIDRPTIRVICPDALTNTMDTGVNEMCDKSALFLFENVNPMRSNRERCPAEGEKFSKEMPKRFDD